MKIFHYTHADDWVSIKQNGLEPKSQQRLYSGLPFASFAFFKPIPDEVAKGPFPNLWAEFKGTRGDLLIEITIDPDDPNVLVGDAAYIEGYLYREAHTELDIPQKYKIIDGRVALNLYNSSLIPMKDYLDHKPDYLLPEVQIRRKISKEEGQLRISETQPILEDEISLGMFSDTSIPPLPAILKLQVELKPWIESLGERGKQLQESLHRLKRQNDLYDHRTEETIRIK